MKKLILLGIFALSLTVNAGYLEDGNLYYKNQNYDKAEKMYLKAIQKGNAGAMSNLGNVYFAQKKYDKAEDMYSKAGELLPLLEAGASWEVSAFVSQIYLPSSSDSPCPVFFLFPNILTFLFQHLLYSMPHCNLYQFQSRSTHIYNFFLIISVPL